MKVMKFGGSSVGGVEQIRNTCEIIKKRANPGDIIIESAIGTDPKLGRNEKVTDMLINLCKIEPIEEKKIIFDNISSRHYEIIEGLALEKGIISREMTELEGYSQSNLKYSALALDTLQSFGERMSVKIVAAQLKKMGINANSIEAYNVGLFTDSNYGKAVPLPEAYGKIKEALEKVVGILVITGFIGANMEGNITTLGRGGSDYSAAIFAAALDAECLELWTDVNGIKSANPKIVPNAKTIRNMSFNEAKELSFYGAKLHPKTIWPAMRKSIPVHIMNTFDPDGEFTIITNKSERNDSIVKGITCDRKNYMININSPNMIEQSGFLARVFDAFEMNATSVDMVSTSEASISLTIKDVKMLRAIIADIEDLDASMSVKVEDGKAIICIVGDGMKHVPGVSGKICSTLGKEGINIEAISQGASEINITLIVKDEDAENAVRTIHKEFFE